MRMKCLISSTKLFCCTCSIVLVIVTIATTRHYQKSLRSNHRVVSSLYCHLTMECVTVERNAQRFPENFFTCNPVENGYVSDYPYPVDLQSEFIIENKQAILDGDLFVYIPGAEIIDRSMVRHYESQVTIAPVPVSFQARRRRLAVTGTRSVLVLRISANDTSPQYSAEEVHDFIFNQTQPTLTSQFAKLSFGKLNFVSTQYGVLDINVNCKAKGSSSAAIRDAAISVVASQYGVTSVTQLADHVIFCIPPGTGSWAGSSPINSWRIVLNNKWCGYLSGIMHEMGHNLGLLHSNEAGIVYQDFTSYMSAGFSTPLYPSKSFNGANNWQLGWYSDRSTEIDPHQGGKVITLATFVDYGKSNRRDPVLIRVGNDTFLQYNRAKDFNFQTQEMIDQVTIVQQMDNGTSLLGGVSASNTSFTIFNFEGSGSDLLISVCSSGFGDSYDPDWVKIGLGFNTDFCLMGAESTNAPTGPSHAPVTNLALPTLAPSLPSNLTCEDDAAALFLVSSSLRSCAWLSIRPSLWKRQCIAGNPAFGYCQDTCNVCDSSTTTPTASTVTPTLLNNTEPPSSTISTSPSVAPSPMQSSARSTSKPSMVNSTGSSSSLIWTAILFNSTESSLPSNEIGTFPPRSSFPNATVEANPSNGNNGNSSCYDSPSTKFEVNGTLGNKTCNWLAARLDWQDQLCLRDDARAACPRTCRVCNSSCVDQLETFQDPSSGAIRNCLWLSLRRSIWKRHCGRHDVSKLCPVTCRRCP